MPDCKQYIGLTCSDPSNEEKIIKKISWVSIIGNVFLTIFKLFAGVSGHSGALISDAVHSLSDIIKIGRASCRERV